MTEQDMIIQDIRRENENLRAELEWKQKEIELARRHARQWISVEDRLPNNGVHVLICCEVRRYDGEIDGKYVCVGYYAEANKIVAYGASSDYACDYSEEDDEFYLCEGWYEVIKNWDDYDGVAVEDFVTHWMPLPELPKGE